MGRSCKFEMYDDVIRDRESGMTYEEIGKKYGVTRQRVGQICGKYNKYNFRVIKENGCVYKNLRKWMNDNSIGRSELVSMLGIDPGESNSPVMNNFRAMLLGKKSVPDAIIAKLVSVTGMNRNTIMEVEPCVICSG